MDIGRSLTLRFLARFLRPKADPALESETLLDVEGETRGAPSTVSLTRLIGHAKAAEGLLRPSPAALGNLVREAIRFAATMRRVINNLD